MRYPLVNFLLVLAVCLAFTDEVVRKSLPGTPVAVTAIKDVLIFMAGAAVFLHGAVPLRYFIVFLPWLVLVALSLTYVSLRYGSHLVLLAGARTYAAGPLIFAAAYYLGFDRGARRRVMRVFAAGAVCAILVAVLQEYAPESLPGILLVRIYKESHSLAGGDFNESLFASPQTLAHVTSVFLMAAVLYLIRYAKGTGLLFGNLAVAGAAFTLLLSRTRTSIVLGAAGVLIVLALARKANTTLRQASARLAVLAAAAAGILLYTFAAVAAGNIGSAGLRRDVDFFSRAFRMDELVGRLLLFRQEGELRNHDLLVGYGAGTGGMVRELIPPHEVAAIPRALDSGLYLLFHETGLVGVAAFLLCYVGLPLGCALRVGRRTRVPGVVVPALAVSAVSLAWFLFKSHTIISNGLSHAILWTAAGLCAGALDMAASTTPDGDGVPWAEEWETADYLRIDAEADYPSGMLK